jgi:hypothetical protein
MAAILAARSAPRGLLSVRLAAPSVDRAGTRAAAALVPRSCSLRNQPGALHDDRGSATAAALGVARSPPGVRSRGPNRSRRHQRGSMDLGCVRSAMIAAQAR